MPQEKCQVWVKRFPTYIKEAIRLQGGNEYKEGRLHTQRDRERARERERVRM